MLPLPESGQFYIEPFCGMASVLLNRQPVGKEVLNDRSLMVVSWWEAIRDHTDELERRMTLTPSSRHARSQAWAIAQQPLDHSVLDRAWAFQVLVQQSYAVGMTSKNSWANHPVVPPTYQTLAGRLAKVHLECYPALRVLELYAKYSHAVLYCDPPYPDTMVDPYLEGLEERNEYVDLLLAQQGQVAVSGAPGNWPELEAAGWDRHSITLQNSASYSLNDYREECLWVNYEPPLLPLTLDL